MYNNVSFINNNIYLTNINKKGIVETGKPKQMNSEYFIEDKSGDYSILKSNKKMKLIEIPLKEHFNNLNTMNNSKITTIGLVNPAYQYISKFKYNKKRLDVKLRHHHLDIEVNAPNGVPDAKLAKEKITLIQVLESDTNNVYIFSSKDFNDIESLDCDRNIFFSYFENEKEMIEEYIKFVKNRAPSTINAWFGYMFDFPYIINRCKKLKIDYLDFSPHRKFKKKKIVIFGKEEEIDVPIGIYWFDSKIIYEWFSNGSRASYKLGYIANYELNKTKVSDVKNSTIQEMYNNNIKLFLEYGIRDVTLLGDLEDKLGYLDIICNQAWDMGVNFDDVFSTIKPWNYKIYNELKLLKILMPINDDKEKRSYSGGYILHPVPGKYKDIVGFDIVSEYPNSIRANNISYETLVEDSDLEKMEDSKALLDLRKDLKNNNLEEYLIKSDIDKLKEIRDLMRKTNLVLSPSGEFFFKEKDGILPKVIKKIFDERKEIQIKTLEYSKLLERTNKIKESRRVNS